MTTLDFDILVVGAGPAGATAARAAAAAGARVCVLERARFPRNKPCGGAISRRVLHRFPYLAAALPRIATHWISRLYLEAPAGESVTLESPEPAALMIRRVEFDSLLATLAVEQGAALHEGATVSRVKVRPEGVEVVTREGQTMRAAVLIAADGVNGVVTRRLGLHAGWPASGVAIDLMEETPASSLRACDPDSLWVSYGYGGSHGYAYVFPKRDHVNVGVGYVLSYYRSRVGEPPYDLQRRFVDSLRHRATLEGESRREHFTPYHIPVAGPIRRTTAGPVLVAGDAGGFVNGFSAEGIYYAMVSGELAAKAALKGLEGGAAAADGWPRVRRAALRRAGAAYESAWRREIGRELADSVIVQRFLFDDLRRVDAMVAGARRHPALANSLIAYSMGCTPYQDARRRLLTRFPLLALSLAATWMRALTSSIRLGSLTELAARSPFASSDRP